MISLRNKNFQLNNYNPNWNIIKGNAKIMKCTADGYFFDVVTHSTSKNNSEVIFLPH